MATPVARDQVWFERPQTQRRIRKAEAEIAEGRTHVTYAVEEAQALLDSFKRQRRSRVSVGRCD